MKSLTQHPVAARRLAAFLMILLFASLWGATALAADDPVISTPPTASPITYGQALSASALTGGVAESEGTAVGGTFAWETPGAVPSGAGDHPYNVIFTPTDTATYNPVTVTVTVSVGKAAPNVTAWPAAGGITYPQKLSGSALTGGSAKGVDALDLPGTFAWADGDITPPSGSSTQAVTFTPTDTANYAAATGTATVTVAKGAATVSAWPAPVGLVYGKPLSQIALSGGTGSVPGTFSWTSGAIMPDSGSRVLGVTFTPTDTSYSPVTGTITAVVAKAEPKVSAWPSAGGISSTQPLSSSALTGGAADVAGVFTWSRGTAHLTAGTHSELVIFTPDSANYLTVTGYVTVTVTDQKVTYTTPLGLTATVGQKLGDVKLPAGFAWEKPDTALARAGLQTFKATYTPSDTALKAVTGILVGVTVKDPASSSSSSAASSSSEPSSSDGASSAADGSGGAKRSFNLFYLAMAVIALAAMGGIVAVIWTSRRNPDDGDDGDSPDEGGDGDITLYPGPKE